MGRIATFGLVPVHSFVRGRPVASAWGLARTRRPAKPDSPDLLHSQTLAV